MARRRDKPRTRQTSASPGPSNWLLVAGIALLLLAAGGIFFLLNGQSTRSSGSTGTGPRFTVDQERIDLGKQPLGKTVHAEFKVKNTGDQVLVLDTSAPIQAVEGC